MSLPSPPSIVSVPRRERAFADDEDVVARAAVGRVRARAGLDRVRGRAAPGAVVAVAGEHVGRGRAGAGGLVGAGCAGDERAEVVGAHGVRAGAGDDDLELPAERADGERRLPRRVGLAAAEVGRGAPVTHADRQPRDALDRDRGLGARLAAIAPDRRRRAGHGEARGREPGGERAAGCHAVGIVEVREPVLLGQADEGRLGRGRVDHGVGAAGGEDRGQVLGQVDLLRLGGARHQAARRGRRRDGRRRREEAEADADAERRGLGERTRQARAAVLAVGEHDDRRCAPSGRSPGPW